MPADLSTFRMNRGRGVSPRMGFQVPAICVFLLLQVLLALGGCGPASGRDSDRTGNAGRVPERIISTAPSITEIVFALGAGEKLAGVTRFCEYPPEARNLPKVGGLLDPAAEAIVRLKPDLVIVLEENGRFRREMTRGGYRVLSVDHKNIQGIINSVEAIGTACGKEDEALALAGELRQRTVESRAGGGMDTEKPRVLISVGRDAGNGSLGKVHIAGNDGYYDEMISLAGGTNAYSGKIRYPAVSIEGLLRMNPDVILDLVPGFREKGLEEDALLREWSPLKGTSAWDSGRVHVMNEGFWTLPGPRFIKIIESLSSVLENSDQTEKGAGGVDD